MLANYEYPMNNMPFSVQVNMDHHPLRTRRPKLHRYLQGEPFSTDFIQSGSNKAKNSQTGPKEPNESSHIELIKVLSWADSKFLGFCYFPCKVLTSRV